MSDENPGEIKIEEGKIDELTQEEPLQNIDEEAKIENEANLNQDIENSNSNEKNPEKTEQITSHSSETTEAKSNSQERKSSSSPQNLKSQFINFLMKHKLYVIIGTVVLILFIYFIFIYTRPFHRYVGLLPFVTDPRVVNILSLYLTTQPSRHAFFVTGPHGTGKTTLISNISKSYTEAGNLSINLDFSLAKSAEEVIGFGKLSLIKSLQAYIKEDTKRKQKTHISQKSNKKEQNQQNILNQKQDILPGIFKELVDALNISITNSRGVTRFFDILENISSTYHPAVFIYGGNNPDLYTPQLYSAIIARLMQKDIYVDHIPVIIESTNTLLKNEDLPFYLRILQVDGVEDPYDAFVHKTKCFTKSEMKKVLQNIGNNGGEIEAVFESLKVGHDINAAIDMRYQAANQTISNLIKKGTSFVLRDVCGVEKPYFQSISKTDSVYQMAVHGYVYLDKANSLRSSTKLVQKLIC